MSITENNNNTNGLACLLLKIIIIQMVWPVYH
jgi:hypothetical protein